MNTPIPANEAERLAALKSYSILDTAPEAAFDELVQLAAHLCDVPMAAISLVDSDRQWFKARLGLEASQTDRNNAFCAHGIVHATDMLVVNDARQDPRFANLPLVNEEPHIQFYTGAKLTNSNGFALGMLCVMDHVARKLDERQEAALQVLARQVTAQLELRRELADRRRHEQLLEASQNELRQSESLYHSLVENLPLIILRKDKEGRITFANQLFGKVLLRSQSELIGRTDFDLMPKAAAERIRAIDLRAMATGESIETVEEIPGFSGPSVHVQIITTPFCDADGLISGVQVISRDFTDRHKLELQLLEAQEELEGRVSKRTAELEMTMLNLNQVERRAAAWKERYDLIVNSAGLAVYEIDRATGEMHWNSGAERVLGLNCNAANRSSDNWRRLIHEQDRDLVANQIETAVNNGRLFDIQYRVKHGADHYRWLRDRGLTVVDSDGRCSRVIGMVQDVTQRKLAEDTMREQATLLDQSQDAIMVRDLNHRVLYWNQTAEKMYGWSFGEALGRPVQDLLLKGDVAHMLTAQGDALEKGGWSGEVNLFTKAGKQITVNSRWTILRDPKGNPQAYLVTHTDLSEQKLLEAKFLRAQRLESVGALASGIAHDLNNIFTPILMSAQLLGDKLDDSTRSNMLNILTTSALRGSEMVKQVLTFARGNESGPGLVQLKHLISELEKMMRDTFPRNIRIEKNVDHGLLLVRGDATQLFQVLINLCVNARDAMPKGGILRLEARNHISQGENSSRQIYLTVGDTGSGMSAEVKAKIYEPFFTTKEVGKGTGLGLSTVLSLVKAHGGNVELESEVGVGTKFNITLPAEAASDLDSAPKKAAPPVGNGEMILIVDDESVIRQIMKTSLEAHGYDVLLAEEGTAALDLYSTQQTRIALVITDIAMPGMDGHEIINELRKINPKVKVIAITGLTDPKKLEQLSSDGFLVLNKPVSSKGLLQTISDVLQEGRAA